MRSTWFVGGIGLLTEIALILGLAWPLRIWQPADAITAPEPLSQMAGASGSGLLRLVLALAVWFGAYAAALVLSRRALASPVRLALFGLPLLFALTLAPTWPAASKDVYHYVMEGRLLVVHGLNPIVVPPAREPHDPLFWILSTWQWEPSRYGPLWTLLTVLPILPARDSLVWPVLGFKAIALLAYGVTCVLVYLTARRLQPENAVTAYVLVAWNPLFLFEAAANGHNDMVMLAFTALALYLAVRGDWTFAFPALAAAVLVKYVTGLLGPLLLVYAWQECRRDPSIRSRVLLGLLLAVWLVLAAYALVWEGTATLTALRGAADEALNSPGWLLREALRRTLMGERMARLVVGAPLTALFLAGYALALRAVWRRPRLPTLIVCGVAVLSLYLVTVSWWFWPWYVTWLLPLVALMLGMRAVWLVAVWSLAAMSAYVPITYRPVIWGEPSDARTPFTIALTVFLPPLLVALVWYARRRAAPAVATPSL